MGDTRFECEAHGPIQTPSCWTCAASGEMTSRVQVDMSKPAFAPPLPTAERIAQIRAEYKRNEGTAETYGCSMDAKCVRDLLAALDAEVLRERALVRAAILSVHRHVLDPGRAHGAWTNRHTTAREIEVMADSAHHAEAVIAGPWPR